MTPWIAPDAPRRPPLHSPDFKVRRALARLKESLIEVRRISHRLRPAMLDTLGLPAALELVALLLASALASALRWAALVEAGAHRLVGDWAEAQRLFAAL